MNTAATLEPETVFERHELKYRITGEQRRQLAEAMKPYLKPDPYGPGTVASVYYDTPDFRLIRRSLEKPVYKEKLRLRGYGEISPGQPVFLELKKKFRSIVYKRRILVSEPSAAAFLAGKSPLPEDGQIAREIDWFRQYYRELIPAVLIACEREGFVSPDDLSLRVTFDENIRWRDGRLRLTEGSEGEPLLGGDECLMEIKAADAMPIWLVRLLSEGHIRQVSFSKYGAAYETMMKTDKNIMNRGVFCA
jgi:hypothetical protein